MTYIRCISASILETPDPPLGPDGVTFEAITEFFSQENYDEVNTETKTSMLVQLAFVMVHGWLGKAMADWQLE
ncbi:hypothetical protein FJTKL_14949 [Diaporthe vaccinii]|uniref:Uncharacterized protein n=1 Tax=Diaporthe vaccinii TaxID=105482 RepID=A0ABR4E6W5_9PEZI